MVCNCMKKTFTLIAKKIRRLFQTLDNATTPLAMLIMRNVLYADWLLSTSVHHKRRHDVIHQLFGQLTAKVIYIRYDTMILTCCAQKRTSSQRAIMKRRTNSQLSLPHDTICSIFNTNAIGLCVCRL